MSKSSAEAPTAAAQVRGRPARPRSGRCAVADEHMGFPAVGQPVVPEPVSARSVTCALTFVLRSFIRFACCASVSNSGHTQTDEGDAPAVGKPFERGAARRELGQPSRLAAVGGDQIDLRFAVVLALRGEGDPLAVRRPVRFAVLVARGQPPRRQSLPLAHGMPVGNSHSSVLLSLLSMSKLVTAAQATRRPATASALRCA